MIYKVIRGFTDLDGTKYETGTYAEIENDKLLRIRTRIRRRQLLLARDQEGAKKLVNVDRKDWNKPKKPQSEKVEKKQPKKVKNVKKTKKQKSSVS